MAANRAPGAVARRFKVLLGRLSPAKSELTRTTKHFATIRARLKRRHNVVRTVRIGSHAKGTAVAGRSDLDMLVVLSKDDLLWGGKLIQPGTLLNRVREDLASAFPQTRVGRAGMAVTISFGRGAYPLDVVPAVYAGRHVGSRPLYFIPAPDGSWIETSPEAHTAGFLAQDKRSGARLKRVVQLVKHWAGARVQPIPINSFHVELVLASRGVALTPGPYSRHVATAFQELARRAGAAIVDPLRIAHLVPCAATPAKRAMVADALRHAHTHARAAVAAESAGNTAEAIRQWRIVFNLHFPAR